MKRNRHVGLAVVLGFSLWAAAGRAAIIEDFQFNDPNNSALGTAANSANMGNNWLVHANTVDSFVTGGLYRIQKQSATAQASNALEIANITSGKAWLVVETGAWNYTATPSSPSERMRFAFMQNDPASTGGSTVTAEMNIDRSPAGGLMLTGDAIGFGSVDPAGSYAMGLTRATPLKLALELDKTLNTFTIYYKDGAAPWGSFGSGVLGDVNASMSTGMIRNGNSVRFAFTGTYGDTNEFFDVDRIYVTTMNPIPEPATWLLAGLVGVGIAARRRRAG